VTSGLTVYLNAKDASSYSGTGTTWKDLSGQGHDATLGAGMDAHWNSAGYFSADGIDDYATFSAGTSSYNSFTMQVLLNPTSAWSSLYSNTAIFGTREAQPVIFNIASGTQYNPVRGVQIEYFGNWQNYNPNPSPLPTTGVWQVYTWAVGAPSSMSAWKDTTEYSISNTSVNQSTTFSSVKLCQDPSPAITDRGFQGGIKAFLLYNRKLTSAEIQANVTYLQGL
jgi:hypothetical protein